MIKKNVLPAVVEVISFKVFKVIVQLCVKFVVEKVMSIEERIDDEMDFERHFFEIHHEAWVRVDGGAREAHRV